MLTSKFSASSFKPEQLISYLSAIALRIQQSLELDQVLSTTVNEIRDLLQVDRVLIYKFAHDMSGTVEAESVGDRWKVSLGDNIVDSCFQSNAKAMYSGGFKRAIDNIYQLNLAPCHIQLLEQYNVKANLVVPILIDNQLWGLLIVHQCSDFRTWQPVELDSLDQISVQIAIAIQRAELHEKLQSELAERRHSEQALQLLNLELEQQTKSLAQVNAHLEAEIAERLRSERSLQESQFCLQLLNAITTGRIRGLSVEQVIEDTLRRIRKFFHRFQVAYYIVDEMGILRSPLVGESSKILHDWIDILSIFPGYHQLLQQGEPIIVDDITHEDLPKNLLEMALKISTKALLSMPLQHTGRLVGLLSLSVDRTHHWTAYEIGSLMEIANHLSFALQEVHAQGDRLKAETALQEANEKLEIRVQERTAALQEANIKLEQQIGERLLAEEKAHDSEYRFRMLVEQSPYSINRFTPNGTLFQFNSACKQLWHKDWASLIDGFNLLSYPHIMGLADYKDQLLEAFKGATIAIPPIPYKPAELGTKGNPIWIESFFYPIKNEIGELQEVVMISEDVSDRKRAETEILQTLEKSKELNELRSRIVSTVSHEFRTPLTSIKLAAEILQNHGSRLSQEKLLLRFHRIYNAVDQMTDLMDDMLTFSKSEMGRLEFNPTPINLERFCLDLVRELQDSKEMISKMGDLVDLEFICDIENAPICLDVNLLRHILMNLLSNAIKYSPQGGKVLLQLQVKDGQSTIQVKDSGIGIPEDDLAHLFEPFHRASNVGIIPGTGLGLAIVKQYVELQGGNIDVKSNPGQGTAFTVTIPCACSI
jgi:signal transduction histidine kinase/GAF domain-containing protein